MSLDHYHALRQAGDPQARLYLEAHFEPLFAEAVARFSAVGWSAIALAAAMACIAVACWWRLRRRLPLPWLWLLPLLVFIPYAFIKASVVYELIRLAPEMPQMWSLYFKQWTPFKMVRTPTTGLALSAGVMAVVAHYRRRRSG